MFRNGAFCFYRLRIWRSVLGVLEIQLGVQFTVQYLGHSESASGIFVCVLFCEAVNFPVQEVVHNDAVLVFSQPGERLSESRNILCGF